jgi:hypothetical protein
MNPGIIDGASQVASSAIEAMRSAPVLIALVILQGITLAVIGYNVTQRQRDMAEERKMFAEERRLFIEQCVIPRAKE